MPDLMPRRKNQRPAFPQPSDRPCRQVFPSGTGDQAGTADAPVVLLQLRRWVARPSRLPSQEEADRQDSGGRDSVCPAPVPHTEIFPPHHRPVFDLLDRSPATPTQCNTTRTPTPGLSGGRRTPRLCPCASSPGCSCPSTASSYYRRWTAPRTPSTCWSLILPDYSGHNPSTVVAMVLTASSTIRCPSGTRLVPLLCSSPTPPGHSLCPSGPCSSPPLSLSPVPSGHRCSLQTRAPACRPSSRRSMTPSPCRPSAWRRRWIRPFPRHPAEVGGG